MLLLEWANLLQVHVSSKFFQCIRPLFLEAVCFEQLQLPPVPSHSASAACKSPTKNIDPFKRSMPIFGHWFATEVWDIFSKDLPSDSVLKLQVDDRPCELSSSRLDLCAEAICATASHFCENIGESFLVKRNELCFSSLVTGTCLSIPQ